VKDKRLASRMTNRNGLRVARMHDTDVILSFFCATHLLSCMVNRVVRRAHIATFGLGAQENK
jgi:hypothetical protein